MCCLAWEYVDVYSSSVLLSNITFRYALMIAKKCSPNFFGKTLSLIL
jgi:hypothetical protein